MPTLRIFSKRKKILIWLILSLKAHLEKNNCHNAFLAKSTKNFPNAASLTKKHKKDNSKHSCVTHRKKSIFFSKRINANADNAIDPPITRTSHKKLQTHDQSHDTAKFSRLSSTGRHKSRKLFWILYRYSRRNQKSIKQNRGERMSETSERWKPAMSTSGRPQRYNATRTTEHRIVKSLNTKLTQAEKRQHENT